METKKDNYENGVRSSSRTSINIKIPLESDLNVEVEQDSYANANAGLTSIQRDLNNVGHSHVEDRVPYNTTRTVTPGEENQTSRNLSLKYYHAMPSDKLSSVNSDKHSNYRPTALNPNNAEHQQIFNGKSSLALEPKNIGKRDQQKRAVLIIERAWVSYRNKQMFKLLKNSVCAAENSLSYEILRKVSPKEAEFFSHKHHQIRLRFRFGGEEFPPMIFFKIFIQTGVQKVKYLSGRKMIKPATEASADALKQMGNRNFYNLMLQDTIRQQSHPVTDEVDITTLKDYMQYLSNLDESPANQGGKENYWRKLTLDVLPRQTIFFDVVDFAYNNHLSATLKKEMQLLTARPVSQMMLVKQFKAISRIRSQQANPPAHYFKSSKSVSMLRDNSQVSGRQTKQAREKVMKMRQLYSQQYTKDPDDLTSDIQDDDYLHYGQEMDNELLAEASDEEWDQEAHQLYQWTQGLSFSDDMIHSPLVTF
uniref:Uncharacterized protein n=1 Tax=Biomphalaria glabrata TaxID=6526 RepID=A0A2C9KG98_BIOGL